MRVYIREVDELAQRSAWTRRGVLVNKHDRIIQRIAHSSVAHTEDPHITSTCRTLGT